MRRALTSMVLLVVVALTAGCSVVQVRTWFRVFQGRDISVAQATDIARNLNRNITPGCDDNYYGRCVPNNQLDVDCVGQGDGPAFVRGPFLVPGWDHYGLDPDRDKVACETPPPPPPKPTTTTLGPRPPVISSFGLSTPGAQAPQLTTFRWAVSDANGDPLTCRLDFDADGSFDAVIPDCGGSRSRNHLITTVGTTNAILEVNDGALPAVTANASATLLLGPTEPYDIEIREVTTLTDEVRAAFEKAKAKWEAVLLRGVSPTLVNIPADDPDDPDDQCFDGAPALAGTIDDLHIDIVIRPIDGAGGTLGLAGPCYLSDANDLTSVGVMAFDTADVAALLADDRLDDVIVHEMAHVLGFGSLWDYPPRSLVAGKATSNPTFVGHAAVAAYDELGGQGAAVPLESGAGPTTAEGHWRESVFGNELMTGFIDPELNPLSALSIASLADLGYQVDPAASDEFSLPPMAPPLAALRSPAPAEQGVVLRPPIRRLP